VFFMCSARTSCVVLLGLSPVLIQTRVVSLCVLRFLCVFNSVRLPVGKCPTVHKAHTHPGPRDPEMGRDYDRRPPKMATGMSPFSSCNNSSCHGLSKRVCVRIVSNYPRQHHFQLRVSQPTEKGR